MNIKDFIKYEFIGLKTEIIFSNNKSYIGLYGEIIDETKNTFTILTEDGKKKIVIKELCTFLFYFEDYWIVIDGKLLIKRPWERIKTNIIKKI